MALELKQSLKLSQQLVMTPQLQQAIKLLQLNRMELSEMINQELVNNPALEESEAEGDPNANYYLSSDPESEQRRDEDAQTRKEPTEENLIKGKDDFNWENYVEEFSANQRSTPYMKETNEDLPSFENILTRTTTLKDHLSWQLSMLTLAPEEKKLGELIVGNLSDDGYLTADLVELAKEVGLELEDAEEVLRMIQNLDPVGVAARDLKDCLGAQARLMNPRQPLVEKVIEEHLPQLEKKNYSAVAKSLGIPLDEVIQATRIIMEFEPKPGRSFQSSDTQYITPDIYVYKTGDEFTIVLNEDGLPKLKISPYYREILAANQKNKSTKDYVQEKLRSALWLIRSIHNRQKTIYKVTEAIIRRQKEFFEKGVQHLKPMVLKDVANDIGMHESTISRVTTNKFVHTPMGIFELKYFFNSSINAADGIDSVASEAVKEKIRQLVSKEDPKHPLSDQKIVELLKKDNVDIARRTVAKYRDILGILSSGKRKKVL